MIRLSAAVAVLAASLGTPVAAQTMGYYVATPVTPPAAKARFSTGGTPWFVRGTALLAPRAPERPARVCTMIAGKVGPLAGFAVAGQAFDAASLAACNAAAKPPASEG